MKRFFAPFKAKIIDQLSAKLYETFSAQINATFSDK